MMLQNLMENYLSDKKTVIQPVSDSYEMPLKTSKSTWIIEKNSLRKKYKFEERKPKEAFIVQLIKYNRETDADLEFRCRGDVVAVIIRSLAPELSEIEFEAKEDCDKIKKDVSYYYAKEE
jgi:hypothetical protein